MRWAILLDMTSLARALTVLAGLLALSVGTYALSQRGADVPQGSATLPAGHRLVPVFAEEFDAPALDPRVWGHVFADPGTADRSVAKRTLPGNAERQVYFDRDYLGLGLDPFRLHDGMVTITAAPLDARSRDAVMQELAGLPGQRDNPVLRQLAYSSGLLTTRGLFTLQHGYFEARLRFTGGKGVWPAFWLLREDSRWPPEIDIVEALGHDPHTIYASVHSAFAPKHTTRRIAMQGDPAEFHRYGALWLPDRIEFYLDGRLTETIPATSDMDRPMYLLLNLAIGGNWPGDPDSSTPFPARMDIDWVRVWRLEQP